MQLKNLQQTWNDLGASDPMWAVLVEPGKDGCKWDEEEFFASGRRDIDVLVKHAESQEISFARGNALDFGCGLGRLTQALADHFDAATGVDIASSMITQARSFNKHSDRCSYFLNEQPNLEQFASEHFDFVFTTLVLQHMPQRLQLSYISEFLRLLKPGGLSVFQVILHNRNPEGVPPVKRMIRNIMPREVRRVYWNSKSKLKSGGFAALFSDGMDMYTLEQREIEQVLAERGGKIIHTSLEPRCTGDWTGIFYWVRKV